MFAGGVGEGFGLEVIIGLEFGSYVLDLLVGGRGEVWPVIELSDGDEEGVVGSGEFWGGGD